MTTLTRKTLLCPFFNRENALRARQVMESLLEVHLGEHSQSIELEVEKAEDRGHWDLNMTCPVGLENMVRHKLLAILVLHTFES